MMIRRIRCRTSSQMWSARSEMYRYESKCQRDLTGRDGAAAKDLWIASATNGAISR